MSCNFLTQAILPHIYYTTGRHVDSTAVPSFVYGTDTLVAFFGSHSYNNNIHVTWHPSTWKVFVFCRTGSEGQLCKVWELRKLICHCFLEPPFQSREESCPSVVSRKGQLWDFGSRRFPRQAFPTMPNLYRRMSIKYSFQNICSSYLWLPFVR